MSLRPRYHLYLDKEDVDWFKQVFDRDIGFSKAIRLLMKAYRRNIEAQTDAQRKGRKLNERDRENILAAISPDGLRAASDAEAGADSADFEPPQRD